MRKIPFMIMIIALLIGAIGMSVRAQSDKGSEAPISKHYSFLPAVLMGPHWRSVANNQIPKQSVTKFFDTAACGGSFYGGTNEGLYRLTNRLWNKVTENKFPGDLIVAAVTFRNNECDTVYAVARGQGLWRGQKQNEDKWGWDRIDDPRPLDDDTRYVLVTVNNEIFLAGDFGVRWAEIPDDQVAAFAWQETNLNSLVTSISESDNNGRLLATVWNQGVYEWKDQTKNWSKWPGDLPDTLVYYAAINQSSIIAGAQSGLFLGLGGPWQLVKGVPEETTYTALAYKGTFFVGQRSELVHKSVDDGKTWKPLPSFPNTREDGEQGFQVRGFDVGLTDGQIYASTTSGVWLLVDKIP